MIQTRRRKKSTAYFKLLGLYLYLPASPFRKLPTLRNLVAFTATVLISFYK